MKFEMRAVKIQFYYDIVSPYSWIGFERILNLNGTLWKSQSLELIPFFLGGVMRATENKPPATIPAKGMHMAIDLNRLAKMYGITLMQPVSFPAMSLKAQRALTSLYLKNDQKGLVDASRALWKAYWGSGQPFDPNSEEDVQRVLSSVLPANTTQAIMNDANAKDRLSLSTEDAIKLGAFGAPWIVVTDDAGKKHSFFGSDRFEVIAYQFGLEYPTIKSKL